MRDIVYVSPQRYLAADVNWKSDRMLNNGYIPILKSDINNFESLLNSKKRHLLDNTKGTSLATDKKTAARTEEAKDLTSVAQKSNASNHQAINKYQSLKEFLPICTNQQLHTVSITNVSLQLSEPFIEQFLYKLKADNNNNIVHWSNSTTIDYQILFVRLNDLSPVSQWAPLFAKLHESIPEFNWEIHYDSNTQRLLENTANDTHPSLNVDEITQYYKTFHKSDTESIDKINDEQDYRIDLNTLSDIPALSIDQLCDDIINFRTKVVKDEKLKKLKQNIEESKLNRLKMMQFFDQIKTSKGADMELTDVIDGEEDEEDEDDESDEVLHIRAVEMSKEQSNQNYLKLLKSLNQTIEPRLHDYQKMIRENENYQTYLQENRNIFLKEIKNMSKDVYYDYDYSRSRKQQEETRDNLDRELHKYAQLIEPVLQESTEQVTHLDMASTDRLADTSSHNELPEKDTTIKIKLAFKSKMDKYVDKESSSETESDEDIKQRVLELPIRKPAEGILPFSAHVMASKIQLLRESRAVDELVKEYLGVYEAELVEYILENIAANKSKQLLLDELKETFDDDATLIADAIWSNSILN